MRPMLITTFAAVLVLANGGVSPSLAMERLGVSGAVQSAGAMEKSDSSKSGETAGGALYQPGGMNGTTSRGNTGMSGISGTRATIVAPLTAGECKGLGGTVTTGEGTSCGTQDACTTVDQDGVVHLQCINKK